MPRVVIIGAGISGLAAGRMLADSGAFEVIILESRNRIGRTVSTNHHLGGAPVELGASWIHGTAKNPLYAIVNSNNICMLGTDNSSRPETFWSDGTRLSRGERDHIDSLFRKTRDLAYDKQEEMPSGQDISLGLALDKIMKRQMLSHAEESGLRHLIATEIENDYATSADQLSLKHWDKVRWFKGQDLLFQKGYDQLINVLARGMDLRLGKPVIEVQHDSQGVKIVTADGATLAAERAVITLPLGVLKKGTVKFSPRFRKEKCERLTALLWAFSISST